MRMGWMEVVAQGAWCDGRARGPARPAAARGIGLINVVLGAATDPGARRAWMESTAVHRLVFVHSAELRLASSTSVNHGQNPPCKQKLSIQENADDYTPSALQASPASTHVSALTRPPPPAPAASPPNPTPRKSKLIQHHPPVKSPPLPRPQPSPALLPIPHEPRRTRPKAATHARPPAKPRISQRRQ